MENIPVLKISGINALIVPTSHRGANNDLLVNLTPYERHAQAALILRLASRVSSRSLAEYLAARFGGNIKWVNLEAILQKVIGDLRVGGRYGRGTYQLLLTYFGHKVSMRSIRYSLPCAHAAADEYKSRVFTLMDKVGVRALAEVQTTLVQNGLIE